MQLADGNTKGSRHCLAHGRGVTVYTPMEFKGTQLEAFIARQHGIDTNAVGWQILMRTADRNEGRPTNVVSFDAAAELLAFAGPIFVLTETNTVTHPEHGDWVLPPGSYRVTYQRTVARDNTVTRVLD
jgi:hypothetical protein